MEGQWRGSVCVCVCACVCVCVRVCVCSHLGCPLGSIWASRLEPGSCASQRVCRLHQGSLRPDAALIGGDKARGRLTAVDLQTGQLHTEQSESILRACMGAGECGTHLFCGAPRILMPAQQPNPPMKGMCAPGLGYSNQHDQRLRTEGLINENTNAEMIYK